MKQLMFKIMGGLAFASCLLATVFGMALLLDAHAHADQPSPQHWAAIFDYEEVWVQGHPTAFVVYNVDCSTNAPTVSPGMTPANALAILIGGGGQVASHSHKPAVGIGGQVVDQEVGGRVIVVR